MAESKPAWLTGSGLNSDMTGEARPGADRFKRFWLPKGSDRRVVFVTEGNESHQIMEHQVRLGGNWQNWFTCLEPMGQKCPLCQWADTHNGDFRRYKALFFTIIDTNEFEDKAGNKHKDVKKLLAAKKDTVELLKRAYLRRLDEDQGMKGAMYEIFRTNSDKSASVGESFEYIKHVDLSVLPDTEPFDPEVELMPKPEEMKLAVERLARECGESRSSDPDRKLEGTDSKVDY